MVPEKQEFLQNWRLKFRMVKPVILILMVSRTKNADYSYIVQRYDDVCALRSQCEVRIDVEKDIQPPVFVSFELSSFFQNIDKYFTGYSREQHEGKANADVSGCGNFKTNAQLHKTRSLTGQALRPEDTAIPCGVVAFSYMNDTYNIAGYDISSEGIAWDSDRGKNKDIDPSRQWISMNDERWLNWMRYSGLSRSRKLWGRIDRVIPKGPLAVTITNEYDHSYYDIKKYLLIHNNGDYTDPILVVTLPCLVIGSMFVLWGVGHLIYAWKRQVLTHRYKLQ